MRAAVLAAVLLAPPATSAQDRVVGTFSLGGRTTRLTHVYAARQPGARDASRTWLVVLLADRPVAEEDRAPTRLRSLAQAGRLRAVRVAWAEGHVQATPYDPDADPLCLPVPGAASIDVQRSDDRLEARLRSRSVGQAWEFDARVRATLTTGGVAIVETLAEAPLSARTGATAVRAEADPATHKKRLATLGYRFSPDELVRAIYDDDAEAVRAFLDAGLSADSQGGNGGAALLHATMACGRGEPAAHTAIIRALLTAGAGPDVRDDNDSSPLIWAAQFCPIEAVEALLDAGADVNARAKGGATPLMMAEVMKRTDVAELLKRAGALPWRQ